MCRNQNEESSQRQLNQHFNALRENFVECVTTHEQEQKCRRVHQLSSLIISSRVEAAPSAGLVIFYSNRTKWRPLEHVSLMAGTVKQQGDGLNKFNHPSYQLWEGKCIQSARCHHQGLTSKSPSAWRLLWRRLFTTLYSLYIALIQQCRARNIFSIEFRFPFFSFFFRKKGSRRRSKSRALSHQLFLQLNFP